MTAAHYETDHETVECSRLINTPNYAHLVNEKDDNKQRLLRLGQPTQCVNHVFQRGQAQGGMVNLEEKKRGRNEMRRGKDGNKWK